MVAQNLNASTMARGKSKTSRLPSETARGLQPSTSATATCIGRFIVVGCGKVYRDYSSVPASIVESHVQSTIGKRKGPRGGVADPFPVKLHTMLELTAKAGLDHVVSWQQPHGRCFMIHRAQDFVEKIMPRFFNQSKYTSFQRQLNLYGFQRVSTGPDRHCYYHPLLLRGRPDLCRLLLRTRVKGGPSNSGEELLWQSLVIRGDCTTIVAAGGRRTTARTVTFDDLPLCSGPSPARRAASPNRRRNVKHGEEDSVLTNVEAAEPMDLASRPIVQANLSTTEMIRPIQVESFDYSRPPPAAAIEFPLFPDLSQASCRFAKTVATNTLLPESISELTFPKPCVEVFYPPRSNPWWTSPPLIVTDDTTCHLEQVAVNAESDPLVTLIACDSDIGESDTRISNDSSVGFFEGRSFRFMDDENLRVYESHMIGI